MLIPDKLKELLSKSRAYNQKKAITGLLLYHKGDFIQVLEGEKQTVVTLFDKISKDNRHQQIIKIKEATWSSRKFPDWSMGFHNTKSTKLDEVMGFKPLKKQVLFDDTDELDTHPAIIVLKNFYQNLPIYEQLAMK